VKGSTTVLNVRVDMKFVYKVLLVLFINIKGDTPGRWAAGIGETPRHGRERSLKKQTSHLFDLHCTADVGGCQ